MCHQCAMWPDDMLKMLYFVSDNHRMRPLVNKASTRLAKAFRPKTQAAYTAMLKVFVAFCIHMKVELCKLNVNVVLAFLECLLHNQCSTVMIANYVSALKAKCIVHNLQYGLFDSLKVKYFLKSVRQNRPLHVVPHNIVDIEVLHKICKECDKIYMGAVFKAMFLVGFFGFMRLSNLAPHALRDFDPSRHFTGEDLFFTKKFAKLLIKWTKTWQNRNKVHIISLPRLHSLICPVSALKRLSKLYTFSSSTSLFQYRNNKVWLPMTDSKVRKCLKHINVKLGLHPSFFTFHSFRRSGATLAYNSHIPIRDIQSHGTWSSDCVWRYIQADHKYGEQLASTLATVINS